MKKTAFILMGLTIIAHTIGFLKELTLAFFYGASSITDAYIISLTIPQTIFAFVGAGIATTLIPLYSKVEREKSTKDANQFTSNLINLLLIICIIIVIITLAFTTPLVKLFAIGFDADTLEMASTFTRISIWGIFFTGLVLIFSSFLQLKNRFSPTGLMGIPLNIVIILSIYLSTSYGTILLAIGSTLALLIQLIYLLFFVLKENFTYTFKLKIKDKYITELVKLSIPVVFGVSVYQMNLLVDKTLASTIVEGGISALSYANKLNALVFSIFAVPIATVFYPALSKQASLKNIVGLKQSLNEAINIILLMVIPATVGMILFAEQIINLLFARGEFNQQDVLLSSSALVYYSIGIAGISLREILYRSFYSLQDTKTPLINAAISLVLNILLNFYLSSFMGLSGLALATSISALFCTTLLIISLRKKIGSLNYNGFPLVIKVLMASIIMGTLSKSVFTLLSTNLSNELSLLIVLPLAVVIYFFLMYFMKVEEINTMVNLLKEKVKKK